MPTVNFYLSPTVNVIWTPFVSEAIFLWLVNNSVNVHWHSQKIYVLLGFRCGFIFCNFSASNSVIATAEISLVFHGDCVISGSNSKCLFFPRFQPSLSLDFVVVVHVVQRCDHVDSAPCTPFVTKLFMTSLLHYEVKFIDVETVGSGGAASKQEFHAYNHILGSS